MVQTKVLEVIQLANDQRAVLLAKTCCYGESGGQAGDRGKISNMDDIEIMEITDTQLDDDDAKNNNHHVWHIGTLKPHRKLEPGTRVKVQFQVDRRIGLMQNHTGTHLLNCVLHQMFPFTRKFLHKLLLQGHVNFHCQIWIFQFYSFNVYTIINIGINFLLFG